MLPQKRPYNRPYSRPLVYYGLHLRGFRFHQHCWTVRVVLSTTAATCGLTCRTRLQTESAAGHSSSALSAGCGTRRGSLCCQRRPRLGSRAAVPAAAVARRRGARGKLRARLRTASAARRCSSARRASGGTGRDQRCWRRWPRRGDRARSGGGDCRDVHDRRGWLHGVITRTPFPARPQRATVRPASPRPL